jgi:hypothetical protein
LATTAVLTDNAFNATGATQTISFTGTALASPQAQVLASVNFGAMPYGASTVEYLKITNVGVGVLTVSPSINGPSYTVTSSTCGSGVTAGNSCWLTLSGSPITLGLHNDLLTLTTNGPTNPVVKLLGTGIGTAPTTSTLDFGAIPYGSTEVLALTIQHITNSDDTVRVYPSFNGPSYTIVKSGDTCTGGLTPGSSCTLPIMFNPVGVGLHDDTLTVNVSGGNVFTVRLLGSASTVAPTASSLNFGTIPYGTSKILMLTIEDIDAPGTVTLTTARDGSSYKVLSAGNTCLSGLTAGHTCTLPVAFTPVSVGLHNDMLTIVPSAGGLSTVPLLGSASQP